MAKNSSSAVFQSFAAKIAIVALNAGTGILTARLLQPTGRGELAAILLWPQILSGVCTLGMPSSITFQLRRRPEVSGPLLLVAMILGGLFGLFATLIVIALMPLLLHQYAAAILLAAGWVVPNTIAGIILLIGRAALEARGDFTRSNLILVLPPTLTVVGLLLCYAAGSLTPVSASLCYIIAGFPSLFLVLRGLRRSFTGWSISSTAAARLLLSYGGRS